MCAYVQIPLVAFLVDLSNNLYNKYIDVKKVSYNKLTDVSLHVKVLGVNNSNNNAIVDNRLRRR